MLDLLQALLSSHPIEASCGLVAVLVMTVLTAYHAFTIPPPLSSKIIASSSSMGSSASTENSTTVPKISAAAAAQMAGAEAPTTMVLIVRTDLGMGHGKVAAQCAP